MFEVGVHSVRPPSTRASDIWSLAWTVRPFFLCCLWYWDVWLDLRACLPIVTVSPPATEWQAPGWYGELCAEVPPSWKSCWESKEVLRTMRTHSDEASFLNGWLPRLAISYEAADTAWQFKLERITSYYKQTTRETPAKDDVSELFGLIRSMLKINPGSQPSAEEVFCSWQSTYPKCSTRYNKHDLIADLSFHRVTRVTQNSNKPFPYS